jgi:formyltetrahydrofolate deformylase
MDLNQPVLLIDCPDEPGLVYKIAGVLFAHGLNVIAQDEYVDPERRHFFIRTAFDGEYEAKYLLNGLTQALPQANVRLSPGGRKKIVVFATREPHCLGDLLIRHDAGELRARIEAVVSNRTDLQALVAKFDIPFHYLNEDGLEREAHEGQVEEVLGRYDADFLVLAKYMRIFSPAFVSRRPARMINIHHSFLPAFVGANPYGQAYRRGVKIIGATAHFVTEDLDEGPIIAQDVVSVDHTHGPAEMARAGRDVEKTVLARALRLVFEDRIFVNGRRTIIFG